MSEIYFRNVDLEIKSRKPLDLLVSELGDDVVVMFNGKSDHSYLAAFELGAETTDADRTINQLCRLIEKLGSKARKIWDSSSARIFDIGYECGDSPGSFRSVLRPKTVSRVASLNATIVITLYPAAENTSAVLAPPN